MAFTSFKEWRKTETGGIVCSIVTAQAIVVFLFYFLFRLIVVPTGSMETTIPTHSFGVCWALPFHLSDPKPSRGDIVAFNCKSEGCMLIKRVIGIGGDTVTIQDGKVYVNDELLDEPYLGEGVETSDEGNRVDYHVPEGCIFVMGDNRDNSKDSRYLDETYFPYSSIKGKALFIISTSKDAAWKGIRNVTK